MHEVIGSNPCTLPVLVECFSVFAVVALRWTTGGRRSVAPPRTCDERGARMASVRTASGVRREVEMVCCGEHMCGRGVFLLASANGVQQLLQTACGVWRAAAINYWRKSRSSQGHHRLK